MADHFWGMNIDRAALVTDSQDWRGKDGAKEYAQILGWVISKLQNGEEFTLNELYSSKMPERWGGQHPADIPLYRAFLHLTVTKTAEGEGTPYLRNQYGDSLASSHKEMSLRPGPRCAATRYIVRLEQFAPDKCLIAIPSRQGTAAKAAMAVLENLKMNRGLDVQAYRGPRVCIDHQLVAQEVATGKEEVFDVVAIEKLLLRRESFLEI